jgi:hypothetical protein
VIQPVPIDRYILIDDKIRALGEMIC